MADLNCPVIAEVCFQLLYFVSHYSESFTKFLFNVRLFEAVS